MRIGFLLGIVAMFGCGADSPVVSDPAEAARLKSIEKAGERIRPNHPTKRPGVKGDWLVEHPYEGQTFAQYRKSQPVGPTATRTTLYVQPIGAFFGARKVLLDKTVESLGLFYGLPVKMLAPMDLKAVPDSARRFHPSTGQEQLDSLAILNILKGRRPDDAVAVLALSSTDLWPKGDPKIKNFVFGQASLRERVGVWSIARLGDPDLEFPLCLQRTIQVALHETGHMFGIQHCAAYECGMNGSNSLRESDRQPLVFCAECEMKLWWNLKLDPARRFGPLIKFAKENDLKAAETTWGEDKEAIEAKPKRDR